MEGKSDPLFINYIGLDINQICAFDESEDLYLLGLTRSNSTSEMNAHTQPLETPLLNLNTTSYDDYDFKLDDLTTDQLETITNSQRHFMHTLRHELQLKCEQEDRLQQQVAQLSHH